MCCCFNAIITSAITDRFVYFSTDEVFGPAPPGVIYGEYDRYNSGNPYAAAKVECKLLEHLALVYKFS